jgi:polyhydroxyalkanoate synthesis regulator phasin
MTDEDKQSPLKEVPFLPWLNTAATMWFNMLKAMPSNPDTSVMTQTAVQNRFTQQLDTNLNLLKSFSRMMGEPESASAAANSLSSLPEILLTMAKSGFDAAMQIQNHLVEKAGKIGKRTEAYNFENLDQEVFKAFSDIYEKEFRQYFKIPPLGLTRFYQERFNEMLDKYNIFETMLAEFLSVLYLPLEKSFKVFQEKLKQMAEEGNLPKEAKESYTIWIKILEGHYISLFRSKEYTDTLHRTLNTLEDFIIVRNRMLEDFLQLLPVVTQREMEDLYKEFHVLKKRVKELEKQLNISPNTLTVVK